MNDSPMSRSGFYFVTQCVSPRERSVSIRGKRADEWENIMNNKRSVTANFPATILRSRERKKGSLRSSDPIKVRKKTDHPIFPTLLH